jgi:hypothetical protein
MTIFFLLIVEFLVHLWFLPKNDKNIHIFNTYHHTNMSTSTYHIPHITCITYPHMNTSHTTFCIPHTYRIPTYQHTTYHIPTYQHTTIYFTPYYVYCLRVFFLAPIFVFANIPLSCLKTIPFLEFKSILWNWNLQINGILVNGAFGNVSTS